LLEAMAPAASAAEPAALPKRLHVFYTPNGMIMQNFVPKDTGPAYTLSPTLKPLEGHRDRFTVITGLAHAEAAAKGDRGGDHGRACPTYLTGVHPKATEGYDVRAGVSMDQIVAKEFGKSTQLTSLELGIEPPSLSGTCDAQSSCAYTNNISWRTPTTPNPVTVDPRDVFERLFGDGDAIDQKSREAQLRRQASVLDFVMDDARRLHGRLGANDRRKIDEYQDSVRDVERRIQKARADVGQGSFGTTDFARPAGIPATFEEHVRLMIDLQVLAAQADLTRVSTLMLGREISNRAYPQIGVPDAHHMLSHHGGDPEKLAKLSKINALHMEQFAYYLKRMSETKEGEGSLLDRTLVLGGSCFGDPNNHDHMNLPVIVAGGLTKGGRHIAVPKNTPMSNLLVSITQTLGVGQAVIGDSTGPLKELTA